MPLFKHQPYVMVLIPIPPGEDLVEEPVGEEKAEEPVVDYWDMTKNELVEELWSRDIEHNKRQVKAELVALLEKDDSI